VDFWTNKRRKKEEKGTRNVGNIKGAVPPLVIINGFTHIPPVLPALRHCHSQQFLHPNVSLDGTL
jgi:hypothetical protein